MAVRGPFRPDGASPPAKGREAALSSLEQALLRSGLAKTPREARALALKLVQALKKAGFPELQKGAVSTKLEGQLKDFQQHSGLPVTGRLDEATLAKLRDAGVLKDAGADRGAVEQGAAERRGVEQGAVGTTLDKARPEGARAKEWRDFSLKAPARLSPGSGDAAVGPKAHEVAQQQAKARAELSRDDAPRSLSGLLEGLSRLGFPGAGKGKERLESALKQLQASLGLQVTGKLDESTVRELVKRGVLPEGSERAAVPSSRGDGPGLREGRGDPEASRGRATADTSGSASASGQGGVGAGEGAPEGTWATAGHTDPKGEVEDDRNAPAGDEDHEDRRRGHATLDDGSESEEGYWEVPPLSAQLAEALERILRDDDARGAATYSWDVTFYRPGVYGRRQPAEPLWHLVVDRASPFDPVWREAREALAARMAEIEPDSAPPTDDDFQRALRRARVREA